MQITKKLGWKDFAIIQIAVLTGENGEDYDNTPKLLYDAMIDSGAQTTVFSDSVIQECNLTKTGTNTLQGVGQIDTNIYHAAIIIPELSTDVIMGIDILEHKIGERPFQIIIGHDILRHLQFTYNGPDKVFTLSLKTS